MTCAEPLIYRELPFRLGPFSRFPRVLVLAFQDGQATTTIHHKTTTTTNT